MAKLGLLIDYEWCTGCHSCEVACQMEHGFPVGQTGIKLNLVGPWEIEEDVWQIDYVPVPTRQCDLCSERVALGKIPTCVHHCQAKCMTYGTIEELSAKLAEKPTQMLFYIDPSR